MGNCRICNEPLENTFANLGTQPICETYLTDDEINQKENFYPLHVCFCKKCFLVQLIESVPPEKIFRDYAYFSSDSTGWINHVKAYVDVIIKKLNLTPNSKVLEIGSNDGYLLKFFSEKKISVLGIDPAVNAAKKAISNGIPTLITFFNEENSRKILKSYGKADLIICNNILAQVPDLNGFLNGLKILLHPLGIMTFEFHHLLNLIHNNQFDTISHERFSYFSFFVLEKLLLSHNLTIFDVEEFSTHGGSLRIYVRHTADLSKPITKRVNELKLKEVSNGLTKIETYISFEENVKETKRQILNLLIKLKQKKKLIAGYGAHAEAHTLLNYCGVNTDFLDYTVDRNLNKQGKFIAGVHIPIYHPKNILEMKPDYVVILPWNIKKEIMQQMKHIGNWDGKFIVLNPQVKLYYADGSEIQIKNII